jgi:translocator protein
MLNSKLFYVFVFLVLNFGALFVGALLMGNPSTNEWYNSLDKAPWTPPGWVFGFSWTIIMLLFSIFMAEILLISKSKKLIIGLFALQWILNVSWNPTFFVHHQVLLAGCMIVLLTLVVFAFLILGFKSKKKYLAFLVLPYFIWLLIASSLNWYVA